MVQPLFPPSSPQLLQVVKHKEELLARRAAVVQSIVKDYDNRRQRVVDQIQNQAAASSPSPNAAELASPPSSSPGLPSPEALLRRVQDLQQEQEAQEEKRRRSEPGERKS